MTQQTTFESNPKEMNEILKDVNKGKVQLPDFQRGWVWDDKHITSLLASISQSFPIGAVMLLETGENMRFKPRLIEGVTEENDNPEFLILDGQQRLTSLFQSLLLGKAVKTRDDRGDEIVRWYYIDMKKALNDSIDNEDAIISLPEDKKQRNFRNEIIGDFSSPEKEFEKELFPFQKIFNSSDWRAGYNEYWKYDKEKIKFFDDFEKEIIKRFEQYKIPIIKLLKSTPKEAVCLVFEKVNTGGVSLTVFELLTATFAMEDFNLREDWMKREKVIKSNGNLKKIENTDFLQAISLLATRERKLKDIESGKKEEDARGIGCKKKDVLHLTLEEYKSWTENVTEGFVKASRILHNQRFFSHRDIPYRTQIVPLAAILTVLGEDANNDSARSKILKWYWCGIFGELYGSAIESKFAKDLPEVLEWVRGGKEPSTVTEADFRPQRLLTLRTRNSAAYKGIFALLMRDGGLDFKTGEPIVDQVYFDDKIDIHHVFPKKWCEENGKDLRTSDCIVNKTPLSARTNRIIGGNAPGKYLEKLQKQFGINDERMNTILQSHVIGNELIRADDYEGFFKQRTEELLKRIENVMGKKIERVHPEPITE